MFSRVMQKRYVSLITTMCCKTQEVETISGCSQDSVADCCSWSLTLSQFLSEISTFR